MGMGMGIIVIKKKKNGKSFNNQFKIQVFHNMDMKIIIIDMDDVIANVYPKLIRYYDKEFGKILTKKDYWGKKIYELEGASHLRDYLYQKGFFADLAVMQYSQEVIKFLIQYYEVFIVTASMEFKSSLEDKYDWLHKHFPFINYKNLVYCSNKKIIKGDYMIDDHARNLLPFKGKKLLYTASHNIHETRFERVNNWLEVKQYFIKELRSND